LSFSPQRILVTGATGFVGRHLWPRLAAAFPGAMLVAATRRGDSPATRRGDSPATRRGESPAVRRGEDPAARRAEGPGVTGGETDAARGFDLLDAAGIRALIAELRPDACVHLAAISAVTDALADPDATWRANVDGTRALAEAILRDAPGCVLLHASSGEVYGLSFRDGRPLDEEAAMRPANPYAAAKAAVDLALGEMALRGLRVLRLRPLNHIGPGQSTRFAVAAFAAQIARIEAGLQPAVIRTGPLDRARDFLDVRDVAAAYVAALARADALPPGQALNLASGQLRRLDAVLDDLLRLSGVAARVEAGVAAPRPVDLMATACDASRATALLDWRPAIAWEATLAAILADWRANVAAGRRS